MELDDQDQTIRIKKEKCDDIDDMDIKLEKENSIEISCDGIKSEEVKMKNQGASGSTTSTFTFVGIEDPKGVSQSQTTGIRIKAEYPDANNTGQPIEEFGTSSMSDTSTHAACYSVWHRIKEEPTTEGWSEVKLEQAEVEIKCEKLESEIARTEFEDTDSLELNKLLDIETKIDPTELSAELDSDTKKKNWSKELHKAHREAEAELFICYNCNYMSHYKSDLIDHISNCELDTGTGLSKNLTLDNHVVKKHTEPVSSVTKTKNLKLISCIHCSQSFNSKKTLGRHIIKNHPDFIASVPCKIHACTSCNYKTTSKSSLDLHMSIHSDAATGVELKSCTQCGKTFKRKWLLDTHIVSMHPDDISSVTSKIHECSECTYKTMNPRQLQKHLLKHSHEASSAVVSCSKTDLICDTSIGNCELDSGTELNDQITLDDGIVKRHPEYNISNSEFDTGTGLNEKITLDDLIAKKHPEHIASDPSKTHKCVHCDFKTTKIKYLNRHLKKHLGTASSNDLIPCAHCSRSFSSKKTLGAHIIKEHPNFIASIPCKIHACSNCNYKSTSKSSLDRHNVSIHSDAASGLELRTCTQCGGTFQTKWLLDSHIVRKHPDDISSVTSKIHKCSMCSYKTMNPTQIQNHLLKHSRKTSSTLVSQRCIHCNVEVKGKRALNCHILKKHPDHIATVTSKIHECSYCVFKTINSWELHKHLMLLHGSVPGHEFVNCSYCNKRFKLKENLDEHVLQKHPNFADSVTSEIHNCPNCTYKTTVKHSLSRHVSQDLCTASSL